MIDQRALSESDYEGWVAWLDGTPLVIDGEPAGYANCLPVFEAVVLDPARLKTIEGVTERGARHRGRQTLEWRDLPHERVSFLELYAFRSVYRRQPVVQIQRPAGHDVRFIQFKKGGVAVSAGMGVGGGGQARTGVHSYVVGFHNSTTRQAATYEVKRTGGMPKETVLPEGVHPCWPRTVGGLGLSPMVFGLTEDAIPAAPSLSPA